MRLAFLFALGLAACSTAGAAPAPAADGGPTWRGDSCNETSDCGWDDRCMPKRCGKRRDAGVACEETSPPPGECVCNENMCTLRPKDAAGGTSAGGCKQDGECAVDVATATCHAGGDAFIGPITKEGAVCTCDARAGKCVWSWSGPVACKTYRDCSLVRTPRLRAVPAKLVPRPVKRLVRPCKDAEIDSVCAPDGTCKIVGWGC